MSSHNLKEVEQICDSVAIIKEGKLVATESIADLSRKHLYTVKARFSEKVDFTNVRMVNATCEIKDDQNVVFHVKGDIAPVLRELGRLPLEDVEVHHASLEEIFMEYYQA